MYEQDYNDRQIEKLIKEYRTKVTRTQSKEYIEWLYNYIVKHKVIYTDSYLDVEERKRGETLAVFKNMQILVYFVGYIEGLAQQQSVPIGRDLGSVFRTSIIYVQLRDIYLKCYITNGLGNWSSIKLIKKIPDIRYVKIPY